MSDPENSQEHATRIALLEHKNGMMEKAIQDIAINLKKLTDLEIHNREITSILTRIREHLDACDKAQDEQREHIRALQDIEVSRGVVYKTMGMVWAAIIGLTAVEAWRFLGHIN